MLNFIFIQNCTFCVVFKSCKEQTVHQTLDRLWRKSDLDNADCQWMLQPNAGNTISLAWLKSGNKIEKDFYSIFPKHMCQRRRRLREANLGKMQGEKNSWNAEQFHKNKCYLIWVFSPVVESALSTLNRPKLFSCSRTGQWRTCSAFRNDRQAQEVKINIVLSILLCNTFIYGVCNFNKSVTKLGK